MMKFILYMLLSFGLLNSKILFFFVFILMLMIIMKLNLFNFWVGINMDFSLDFYSFYLVILSLYIVGLMLLIDMGNATKLLVLSLLVVLVFNFMTFNLLNFYFFFEVSLLPIFMLIKFDSYTFERFESMFYMFFYTMILSMPFLVCLVKIYYDYYSLKYFMMMMMEINLSGLMFIVMMLVVLVKMPMFFIHIWLPKAHVEAPVYGSMVLAGVLLKLGGYGILRLSQLFSILMNSYSVYLISISLIGSILMSLVCLIQIDLKMLVAYSSVVHMGLLIASLSVLSKLGVIGSYLMMIGHGLCSSGLFYIVNISYSRLGSRLIYMNKGLINLNSVLSMWWFLLCISNFSAPITVSLFGEIFMMMSLISFDWYLMIYLGLMCFLGAAYSLYLFSYTQHGGYNLMLKEFSAVSVKEYLMLFLHWFPLNMLSFGLNLFMIN